MSLCKECGSEVEWREENKGLQCFNAGTDVSHWDKCSQLKFERIKRTGEFFKETRAEGYITEFKRSGVQYTMQSSGVRRGKHAISKECGDCVPPWEVCSKPCPNAVPA